MAKRILSVAFKAYQQHQAMLLPPSLDELIAQGHPVRIVNQVLDKIDIDPLLKKYKGGGSSSFHPRMLLKVLVYSYINNTYSSRKIEAALKENIHYMWLSGMNTPDHNTINSFRSDRLKDVSSKFLSFVYNNSAFNLLIFNILCSFALIDFNVTHLFIWHFRRSIYYLIQISLEAVAITIPLPIQIIYFLISTGLGL